MINSIKDLLSEKILLFLAFKFILWIRETMVAREECIHLQSNDEQTIIRKEKKKRKRKINEKKESPWRLLISRHLVMHNSCLLKAWQLCDDNFLWSFHFVH